MKQIPTFKVVTLNLMNTDSVNETRVRYNRIFESKQILETDILVVQELTDMHLFDTLAERAGFPYRVYSEGAKHHATQESPFPNYLAIASKTQLYGFTRYSTVTLPYCLGVRTRINRQVVNIFNCYLEWSFKGEHKRTEQVSYIDGMAANCELDEESSISVILGSLNASPQAGCVRFLKGLDFHPNGNKSTYWTDAWEVAGTSDNEFTVQRRNSLMQKTLKNDGVVLPMFTPNHRVDYVFTKGWNYGKNGCPVKFNFVESDQPLSDHEGIAVSIYSDLC